MGGRVRNRRRQGEAIMISKNSMAADGNEWLMIGWESMDRNW